MLGRLVRIQLLLFTIASVIGISAMVIGYIQAPTLLGIGRITVTLELPAAGGLYRFSNVTYRGVEIGKVTDVRAIDGRRVDATLSLATSPRIPANLVAKVRSVSAVGEQYVDLQPPDDAPPFLHDGSVIVLGQTAIPEPVGPMLDRLDALVGTIPKDELGPLLDDSFKAFNGSGYDIGSLLDSSSKVITGLSGVADQNRALVDDSVPLLDSQAATTDSLREWAHGLAGITDQFARHDPQVRTLLETGPGFAQEVSRLLDQIKPTLPVLLANLTSVGQVLVTYNKSIEQLLVLFPPYLAGIQSVAPVNNPTGKPMGDFAVSVADPPVLHDWLSATDGVALPRRRLRNGHSRRAVLQAAAGFAGRRPRSAQLPVRRTSRQAGGHRAGLRQRPAVQTPGDATTRIGSQPVGSEPDRPGRSAGRSHDLGRSALRTGHGHPAATGTAPTTSTRRAGTHHRGQPACSGCRALCLRRQWFPAGTGGRNRAIQPQDGCLSGAGRQPLPSGESRDVEGTGLLDRPDARTRLAHPSIMLARLSLHASVASLTGAVLDLDA